jgi:hypothetical protein
MREVRDALAMRLEKTPQDDLYVNNLFFTAGMAWGFALHAVDHDPGQAESLYAERKEVEVWVTGPYGTCRAPQDDPYTPLAPSELNSGWSGGVTPGALDFTYTDECLTSFSNGFAELDVPILDNEAQDNGEFDVNIRWVCDPGDDPGSEAWNNSDSAQPYDSHYWQCDSTRTVDIDFVMGNGFTAAGDDSAPATPDPTRPLGGLRSFKDTFQVTSAGSVVARIMADGRCLFAPKVVCSV